MKPTPDEEPLRPVPVDDLVPDPWPPEVEGGLDNWAQGDLLRGTNCVWVGPQGEDPVTGEFSSADWTAMDLGPQPDGWSIVTSQTCDISCSGPGAVQPFVSCSPVMDVSRYTPDKIARIRAWEVTYLALVPGLPEDGDWAVDLRLSIPASKGLLAGHRPIAGYPTEEGALDFAEHVAKRLRRPALHNTLSSDLVRLIHEHVALGPKAEPEWWQAIEEVRLEIRGTRLNPNWVRLIFVCERDLRLPEKERWRTIKKKVSKALSAAGIGYGPPLFQRLDDMPARLYRDSLPLYVSNLGRPARW